MTYQSQSNSPNLPNGLREIDCNNNIYNETSQMRYTRNHYEKQQKYQAFDACFRYEVQWRSGRTFSANTPSKDVCLYYEQLQRSQKEGIFQRIAEKLEGVNRNMAKKYYHQQYRKALFPQLDKAMRAQISELVPIYAGSKHYMQQIKHHLGEKANKYLPYDINNCINSEKQRYDRLHLRVRPGLQSHGSYDSVDAESSGFMIEPATKQHISVPPTYIPRISENSSGVFDVSPSAPTASLSASDAGLLVYLRELLGVHQ